MRRLIGSSGPAEPAPLHRRRSRRRGSACRRHGARRACPRSRRDRGHRLRGADERRQRRGHAAGEPVEIVAAFEHRDDASARPRVGRRAQPRGHLREALLRDAHAGERIVLERIESGADEQHVRLEPSERGQEHVVEDCHVVGVARTRGKPDVDRRATRPVAAELGRCAAAGVVRELMHRQVEHARVVPEDVLRAVAVVDVPVEDRDARGPRGPRRRRGDRDVVDQAEPHRLRDRRVVPGRPHDRQTVRELALHHAQRELGRRARRRERRFPRPRREVRIGIDPAALAG
jgi:hypothetical protein